MTLDLSVVNRIAAQCGINAPDFKTSNTYMALPNELLAFAQACYAMGAADQKEKILNDYEWFKKDGKWLAKAIRSQE